MSTKPKFPVPDPVSGAEPVSYFESQNTPDTPATVPESSSWPKVVTILGVKVEASYPDNPAAVINTRKFYHGERVEVSEGEYRTLQSLGVIV